VTLSSLLATTSEQGKWMLDLIGTWWNWVFLDLMGGNVILMFLFGWEIFMIPIGIAIMAVLFLVSIVVSLFSSK
jgi:hypothetical protein